MRLLVAATAFLFLPGTLAFVNSLSRTRHGVAATRRTSLCMAEGDKKKPLTSKEILARARKAAGMPDEDEDEVPKLFEDELLQDMQNALLQLEKRIQEGPGALSAEEVEEFAAASQRILVEMKQHLTQQQVGGSSVPAVATAVARPLSDSAPIHQEPLSQVPVAEKESSKVMDTSQDEGPSYDGRTGMGLAKETRNTYVIPGMDEMSPEEYRKALQQSVLDRQSQRKERRGGVVGNRAALQYLDSLGWGGASDNWKTKQSDEGENKMSSSTSKAERDP